MTQPEAEWVTVAQAAQLLGIAERQCRRIADRLPDRDKGEEPAKGGRLRLVVRLAAIEKAAAAPARSEGAADTLTGQPTGPMMIAAERVIQEQAARIADLQKALDHEREQTQRLQDALAREQTLRALPPPAEAVPAAEPNESGARPKRWHWPWEKETEDK